jgi:two-component system nitrate/nitrite sensor histidine kinase NarX
LNIYLSDLNSPTARERELLETLANEMSLAIESMRLRSRELSTLYYVQQSRKADDLQEEMEKIISHLVSALEISGGMLYLFNENRNELVPATQVGDLLPTDLSVIRNLANSSLDLFDPIVINDLHHSGSIDPHVRALLCAPLRNNQKYLGCLVLWTAEPNGIVRRHVRMMSAIAAQAALLIENHQLYLQAENQAALAERARLAREIHDGLAQTLAFLQLRMAQINKWLERGEVERAVNALQEIETLIDEAYIDAREAIDNLSMKPGNEGFASVFRKVCEDFQSSSGITLTVTDPPEKEIPVSAQIQLLRIVQEALGNIRKHSKAGHAQVNWTSDSNWLTLNISDDGCGFAPDSIPPIAHHGLRIMRERAELLDADLQVISQPGEGAQVIIRMPVDIVSRQADE